MPHIRLLGTAIVEGRDGPTSIKGTRLGLLALLAIHGPRGIRRERIMALLWPEASSERARHLLRDTLYRLREAVGAGAVEASGDLLSLDAAVVTCDVWQFEEAVCEGKWSQADTLYSGPLLDASDPGVSPDFEQWLETERSRLTRLCMKAVECLAEEHESTRAMADATHAWRRLTVIEPYNSRYAFRLMKALDVSGERAAALRHAAAYGAALEADLGAAPDPAILALADQLRRHPTSSNLQTPSPPANERAAVVGDSSRSGRPASRRQVARVVMATCGIGAILAAVVAVSRWRKESIEPDRLEAQSSGSVIAAAQDHYQRGRHYLALRGATNLTNALSEFEGAIREDPQFARAHAGLSSAATLLTLYDGRRFPRDSMLPLALAAAERAVALDESLSESYAALGQVLTYSGRREEAERAYKRSVTLDPNNATARQWFAELLLTLGRIDEAIEQVEVALRLDPQSAINHGVAANHYRIAGRFEDALQMGERAIRLDPTMPAVWEFYANALFYAGHRDSAERLYARHSPRHVAYAYVRAKNGDQRVRDSVRLAIERWTDGATPRNGTVALAIISLAAEDHSAAIRVLSTALDANPAFPLHNSLIDPIYDPIRGLPAFREIVRRARLDETLHLYPRRPRAVAALNP